MIWYNKELFSCVLVLLLSCSQPPRVEDKTAPLPAPDTLLTVSEQPISNSEPEKAEVEVTISLAAGVEAKTQGMNYLLRINPLKLENAPEYSKMQGYPKTEHGAIVFVLDTAGDYAKIRTLTQIEGWIPKENMHPLQTADRNRYFEKRQFAEITPVLGVYALSHINLWNDMYTRDALVAKCLKGDTVIILELTDEHIKVGTVNGKEGWCMKGFVRLL